MSEFEILLVATFGALYIVLVLTLAMTTYRKGHMWLFGLGFLMPPLWLVGAIRQPKPGSTAAKRERERWR